MTRYAAALFLVTAACASSPPPPGPPAIPPLEPFPTVAPIAPPVEVWSREPGLLLRGPVPTRLPYVGMRLAVVQDAGDSLQLRCLVCPGAPVGWADRGRVIWVPQSPADARAGDLAEFVLAVRTAAIRRDSAALRMAMARTFVHAHGGVEGVIPAVRDLLGPRSQNLARLPGLLDRGVAAVSGTRVWAAPPEYATTPNYPDLRAGFMRGEDGWEWIFFLRPGL